MSTTRFAPSPTGYLHRGHAFAARFAARHGTTRFLLRIENIDAQRCRPEFEAAMIEDLASLGLVWETPPRRQSEHLAEYAAALAALRERGVLYPCFCSRAEIAAATAAPHTVGPLYPGTCRGLEPAVREARIAAGAPHAWRLDVKRARAQVGALSFEEVGHDREACDGAALGDVVLGRKDAPASYHLCATHDDARQGVDLVTRGVDLRPAVGVQRLLQALMGWPEPRYLHHPLILGADGRKLSKREGARRLRAGEEGFFL